MPTLVAVSEVAATTTTTRERIVDAAVRMTADVGWSQVTMAKLATQRANFELQDACYGLLADIGHEDAHDLSRAARDARLGPIGGGTDEIMKEILGKTLGL